MVYSLRHRKGSVIHILHIDDDLSYLEISKQILMNMGSFEIDTVCCVEEALKKLATQNYDVVISDYQMPQKDGLQFLKILREQKNETPFILFTGKGREEIAIQALNLGADGYYNKQGSPETVYGELAHGIEVAVQKSRAIKALIESEKRYRNLMEQASEGILIHDLQGTIIDANPQICKSLGYTKEEMLSLNVALIDPQAVQNMGCGITWAKVASGQNFVFQTYYLRKDQSKFPVEVSLNPVVIDSKKQILVLIRDNTERKRAEDAVRQTNVLLEKVGENVDAGLAIIDRDYNVVWANKRLRCLGIAPDKKCYQIFNNMDTVCPDCGVKKVFEQNIDLDVHEYKTTNSKGETIYIELRVTPLRDKHGNITAALELAVPITERKRVEAKLRKSESQYRFLAENSKDVIWTMDLEGHFTYVSPSVLQLRGYSQEEVMQQSITEALTPESAQIVFEGFQRFQETGKIPSNYFELEQPCKDGSTVWTEVNLTILWDKDGNPESFLGVSRDITARKKAEEALQKTLAETQAREKEVAVLLTSTKAMLKNADFTVIARTIFDNCKNLIGVSAGYVALLSDDGSENKVLFLDSGGRSCSVDPSLPIPIRGLRETAYRTSKVVYENNFSNSEWIRLMPEGHVRLANVMFVPLVINGKTAGLMGLANKPSNFTNRDALIAEGFGEYAAMALNNSWKAASIEEQKKKLELLNEKLHVVGGFTRHDVRNKLSIIKGHTYLLKKQLSNNIDLVKHLEAIDLAINQSNKFFDFSYLYQKIGAENLTKIDVADAFNQAVTLIPNQPLKVINKCQGLSVVADSMLRQLFYNLIDNSLKHGKTVSQVRLHYMRDEAGTKLVYEDNGVGIPEEDKQNIFSEGFTTGGSGLGLKLVNKMVQVYGWSIKETGTPGKGAQFAILIPP